MMADPVKFRADHVGSLLRPPALLRARRRHEAGEIADDELRAAEDEAIAAAVRTQVAAGVDVVTDWEFRRRDFRGVTIGMHVCRGNQSSMWMGEGDYEPIAERMFATLPVDRFLLEYDDDRAGGFEPLRFVPAGKVVVLGLVSSKMPALESPDSLRRRIDEAAKLKLVADVARATWGPND
jgi:methionine synthase II (cobalamin-independent)